MTRSYEQYCPLAKALDVVGDRWAMLVLRELFLAPKRFTDLQNRLEGIAPNLLSKRLRELEAAGLVIRRRLEPPAASTVYDVTPKARGLRGAMLELARWGVQFLGTYDAEEAFNLEWLIPVLEEVADRDAARGVWETYEFHIGEAQLWVTVADGEISIGAGSAPTPPSFIATTDMQTFIGLGFEALKPEEALEAGRLSVVGDIEKGLKALEILAPARALMKAQTPAPS